MSIRECAKASEAFAALYDVYTHRDKKARAFRERGGKVCGILGADVPEEILIATGMLPVRIGPDPDKPLKYANIYLEQAFDPTAYSTFEDIVDGTCNSYMDQLVVSHTSDYELRTWLHLREIRRGERQLRVPPVHFVDWLWGRRRLYQERNKDTIRRFRDTVEKWTGRLIEDDEIRAAAEICNDDRHALREFAELRHGDTPRVNGSEALVVIGASFFMDKAEHAKLVRQVTEDARSWPALTGPRIYVTSTAQSSTDLYDAIEATGCIVVGEDHSWGDRSYDRDTRTDIDVTRAIVDRYMLRIPATYKVSVETRVETLDREVADTGAEGVVFYFLEHDEAASWDYPEQKKSLDAHGVKSDAFFRQDWPVAKNEGLADRLAEFAGQFEKRA